MPDGLAAFLAERLNEAEAIALAAGTGDAGLWHVSRQGTLDSAATTGDDSVGCPDGCHPSAAQAEHIAANDPARVLRGIAAKRAILADCTAKLRYPANTPLYNLAVRTLRNLAAEWADHPAYLPEWSPEPAPAP